MKHGYQISILDERKNNEKNHPEHFRYFAHPGGRRMDSARHQCAAWQLHDWPDQVGDLRRHFCCGGHRFAGVSQFEKAYTT